MMTLMIHLFHSRDVVVVISQLFFVAHTVIPVPQLLIPSATDTNITSTFHVDRGFKTMHHRLAKKATHRSAYMQGFE